MQAKLIAGALLLLIGCGAFLPSLLQAKVNVHAKVVAPPHRDEAVAVLESLAESQDARQAGKAWQALGALYESRVLLTSASNAFKRAMRAGERAEADLGRVLLKAGDLDAAGAAAEAARAHSPADADVLLLLANVHRAAGRYPQAKSMLEQARQHSDKTQLGRVYTAECDLLQLQRHLGHAKQLCQRALKLQPVGERERAATERILGLIYYFSGDARMAQATHARALRAYVKMGMGSEAAWLREHVIDDTVEMTTEESALTSLGEELGSLLRDLRAAPEPLWWRISDLELRRTDVLRKQKRWAEAASGMAAAVDAFQRRPAGWEKVPDYAAVFELQGMLARDEGKLRDAREAFRSSLRVVERNPLMHADTGYLNEEIERLTAALAQEQTHKTIDT